MFFLFVIILKKYLIIYVRTCKCKDFKILMSDQESFWNQILRLPKSDRIVRWLKVPTPKNELGFLHCTQHALGINNNNRICTICLIVQPCESI